MASDMTVDDANMTKKRINKKRKRKKIFVFILCALLGMLLAFIIIGGIMIIQEIRHDATYNQMDDSDLRSVMNDFFGLEIPATAGKLFYHKAGWLNTCIHIGMSVEAPIAWEFLQQWGNHVKEDFDDYTHYGSEIYLYINDLDENIYWDITALKTPVYLMADDGESQTIILYDETTERLLIQFTSE